MDGCIYRTKDGECDLYAEGGKFKAFCDLDGCEGRRMSNGDKIRAMTDDELADFLQDVAMQGGIELGGRPTTWLDWLQQEVNE